MTQENRDRRSSPSQIDDCMQIGHVGCETVPLPTDDQSVQKRLELLFLFILDLSHTRPIVRQELIDARFHGEKGQGAWCADRMLLLRTSLSFSLKRSSIGQDGRFRRARANCRASVIGALEMIHLLFVMKIRREGPPNRSVDFDFCETRAID
jgi:hypothetical protein